MTPLTRSAMVAVFYRVVFVAALAFLAFVVLML